MAHTANPLVVRTHWLTTIKHMRSATDKVTAVWIDYGKNCETKKTKLLQALDVQLFVATHFVDRMGVIDMYNNQAAAAIKKLNDAAVAAAGCWTCRKGSAVTQEELDAEHAEFEKHRARLLFES
jgi:hypothetical protein